MKQNCHECAHSDLYGSDYPCVSCAIEKNFKPKEPSNLKKINADLLVALKAYEKYNDCPCCEYARRFEHEDDCKIGNAIKQAEANQ